MKRMFCIIPADFTEIFQNYNVGVGVDTKSKFTWAWGFKLRLSFRAKEISMLLFIVLSQEIIISFINSLIPLLRNVKSIGYLLYIWFPVNRNPIPYKALLKFTVFHPQRCLGALFLLIPGKQGLKYAEDLSIKAHLNV